VKVELESLTEEVGLTPQERQRYCCHRIANCLCYFITFSAVTYAISDLKLMNAVVDNVGNYVENHIWLASLGIMLFIVVMNVLMLPTTIFFSFVSIIYCKVLDSYKLGFLISSFICFTGMMAGMSCAFLVGRKLFRRHVEKMIKYSIGNKKWVETFKQLDHISFSNFS